MGISMGMGMGWDGYGDLMNHRHEDGDFRMDVRLSGNA